MPLHIGKGRSVGTAISDIIDYVENPDKTDKGQLVTSYGCNARIADKEFLFAKKLYIQKTGRVHGVDDVIAYHLRQSFVPGEITPEEANRLGRELAMRFTKGKNAFIVCTRSATGKATTSGWEIRPDFPTGSAMPRGADRRSSDKLPVSAISQKSRSHANGVKGAPAQAQRKVGCVGRGGAAE